MRVHARAIGVGWVIAFAAVALMAWPGRAFATPTASTVTFLDGSSGSGPFKSSATVTMSVTTSESLSTAPVVTFSGAGTPAVTLTGSGTSWSGTVTNLSGNGAVTYTMVLTDGAGNSTTTSSASAFTVDNTGPAIALT